MVVVGGGNSAGPGRAVPRRRRQSDVTVVIRRSDLDASMSRYLVDRIDAHPRIDVRAEQRRSPASTATRRSRSVSGERPDGDSDVVLPVRALFSFIGADPATDWLSGCAALDDHGFVLTDRSLEREHLDERWQALDRRPLPYETSHPGLVRRRRRSLGLDEARRGRRRRRIGRRSLGPRVPRVRTLSSSGV